MADSTLTVTLTPELEAFVERCVASGRFAAREDVIRKAIELLHGREHEHVDWGAELRRDIDIGVEQAKAGQLRNGAKVFDELRERVRRG